MALIGLMMGSILGLFTGVLGWLAFDMALLSAFTLYLCIAFAMMALVLIIGRTRVQEVPSPSGTEVFHP